MIKKLNEDTALKFKSLSPEEKEKKGILGRLFGPVASFTAPTRNGRKYTESLWENLFNSDLIKERFANGGILGELTHPEDREEVAIEKVACVMPEPPVKDKNGQLVAYIDILDTPCGKIAYQLAKYGYKFGISSRGTGDLIMGPNGDEEVDPDTYQLNAFDLVEIPAVESARLAFVESLDKKRYNKTLRQSLQESLNAASEDDRKLMKESLDNLGIKLNESAAQELDNYFNEWKASNPKLDLEDLIDEYYHETGIYLSKIMYSEDEYNNFVDWAWKEHGISINPISEENFLTENINPSKESIALKAIGDAIEDDDDEEELKKYLERICHYCIEMAKDYGLELDPEHVYDNIDEELDSLSNEQDPKYYRDALNKIADDLYDYAIEAKNDGATRLSNLLQNLYDELTIGADDRRLQENENSECAISDTDKEEVVNNESETELVAELQESLLKIKTLEEDNLALREQVSVGSTKELKFEESLSRYKKAIIDLSDKAKEIKPLTEKVDSLTESLNKAEKALSLKESRINRLIESRKKDYTKLDEQLKHIEVLESDLERISAKTDGLSKQLEKSNALVESYKRSYRALKESYLEVKAISYGLTKEEVLSKLNESYKIKDIDSVCKNLAQVKSNMNKLPFRLTEDTKFSVKKSDNEYITNGIRNSDDFVSNSLKTLANLD